MSNQILNTAICGQCETLDCIMKCQYMDFTIDEAKVEHEKLRRGENSSILKGCVTCCGCEEYCPHGNHPFYHIVELQEKFGVHPVPIPVEDAMVEIIIPTGDAPALTGGGENKTIMNMCNFPMLAGTIRGSLFENVATFASMDTFCNLMYVHFARNSASRERIPKVIDTIMENYLKDHNSKELICYHDECYTAYTKWSEIFNIDVPFKPVHFFEFIHRRMTELKNNVKPLNIKAAFQRSCASRLTPETDHFIDDIFEIIGVERVKREYDRDNALCCGAALEMQQRFDLMEGNQEKNIQDMKINGATHCVFSCPLCFFTLMPGLMKAGIIPVLISDLCLQALGE